MRYDDDDIELEEGGGKNWIWRRIKTNMSHPRLFRWFDLIHTVDFALLFPYLLIVHSSSTTSFILLCIMRFCTALISFTSPFFSCRPVSLCFLLILCFFNFPRLQGERQAVVYAMKFSFFICQNSIFKIDKFIQKFNKWYKIKFLKVT